MPSNRFPVISGDGRHVYYSSDAFGRGGLAFTNTNQSPDDINSVRDIYHLDRMQGTLPDTKVNFSFLFPDVSTSHSFSPGSPIPILATIDYNGSDIGNVRVFNGNEQITTLQKASGGATSMSPAWESETSYLGTITLSEPGNYTLTVVIENDSGTQIGSSIPVSLSVSPMNGSRIPTASLDPLHFDSITTNSTIPLSVFAQDEDGSIVGVQFYINGKPFGQEILKPVGISDEEFRYYSNFKPENSGIYSIHAVARDLSGNYVSSQIRTLTASVGIEGRLCRWGFLLDLSSYDFNASDLNVTFDDKGSIILPSEGITLGSGFYSLPTVQITGSGDGAVFEAIVDFNDPTAPLTGFKRINGGSGYKSSNFNLKLVPTIQSVLIGERAIPGTRAVFSGDVRSGTRYFLSNDIDGPVQGWGYVLSPRYYADDGRPPRRQLELPLAGATTSKVQDYDYTVNFPQFGNTRDRLEGGFTHAPVNIEIFASKTNGKIVEVGVFVNGEKFISRRALSLRGSMGAERSRIL